MAIPAIVATIFLFGYPLRLLMNLLAPTRRQTHRGESLGIVITLAIIAAAAAIWFGRHPPDP